MNFADVARCGKTGKLGQSCLQVKQVAGQNKSFLKRVNRVVSQVGLTRIFQTIFFFNYKKQINNLFRENK